MKRFLSQSADQRRSVHRAYRSTRFRASPTERTCSTTKNLKFRCNSRIEERKGPAVLFFVFLRIDLIIAVSSSGLDGRSVRSVRSVDQLKHIAKIAKEVLREKYFNRFTLFIPLIHISPPHFFEQ